MQATAIAPGIPNLRTIASFIFTPLLGSYSLVKFLVSAGIVGLGNNFIVLILSKYTRILN